MTRKLTESEKDILKMIAYGLSNKEICSITKSNVSTVGGHITSIYKKLKVSSRVQACLWLHSLPYGKEAYLKSLESMKKESQ